MIKVAPSPAPAQTVAELEERVRKIEQSINYSEWIQAFPVVGDSPGAADDDYPGYLLLAGRSGGQTANGGTAAANSLTLNANSVAFALANAGRIVLGERVTYAPSASTSATLSDAFITHTGTLTTSNAQFVYAGFDFKPNVDYSTSLTVAISPAFWARPTFRPTTSVTDTATTVSLAGFFGNPFWTPNAAAITPTTPALVGFLATPSASVASGTSGTITNLTAYASFNDGVYNALTVFAPTVGANITATNVRGLHHGDPTKAASGTITNNIAVDVEALTQGGTLIAALRSAIASGAAKYFLRDTGGAQSFLTGKFTTYNATTTAGFGLATIVAAGRSTAQTAAVASVAAFTVGAADGTFRVSANVRPTTATTHDFTVTVAYTDESSTARTLTLTFTLVAGAVDGTPALSGIRTHVKNADGTVPYMGIPQHIRAKASTAITVATTGTFTTVTYNVDAVIEQLA